MLTITSMLSSLISRRIHGESRVNPAGERFLIDFKATLNAG